MTALGDYGDEADPPGIEVAVTLLKPLPPVLAALSLAVQLQHNLLAAVCTFW